MKLKKLAAVILSLMMIISAIPFSAVAEEAELITTDEEESIVIPEVIDLEDVESDEIQSEDVTEPEEEATEEITVENVEPEEETADEMTEDLPEEAVEPEAEETDISLEENNELQEEVPEEIQVEIPETEEETPTQIPEEVVGETEELPEETQEDEEEIIITEPEVELENIEASLVSVREISRDEMWLYRFDSSEPRETFYGENVTVSVEALDTENNIVDLSNIVLTDGGKLKYKFKRINMNDVVVDEKEQYSPNYQMTVTSLKDHIEVEIYYENGSELSKIYENVVRLSFESRYHVDGNDSTLVRLGETVTLGKNGNSVYYLDSSNNKVFITDAEVKALGLSFQWYEVRNIDGYFVWTPIAGATESKYSMKVAEYSDTSSLPPDYSVALALVYNKDGDMERLSTFTYYLEKRELDFSKYSIDGNDKTVVKIGETVTLGKEGNSVYYLDSSNKKVFITDAEVKALGLGFQWYEVRNIDGYFVWTPIAGATNSKYTLKVTEYSDMSSMPPDYSLAIALVYDDDGEMKRLSTYAYYPTNEIASGACGKNTKWKITTDGVLTISGTGAADGAGVANFMLGQFGWKDYSDLVTSVVIESGVTSIGQEAFSYMSNIKTAVLPSGFTTVPTDCFYSCTSLEKVTLPSTVTHIDRYAFMNCSNLTTINIPKNCQIGDANGSFNAAFKGCKKLANENGFVIIKNVLYDYFGSLSNVTIPSGVVGIGEAAFSNNTKVTKVTVPSTCTYISGAFSNSSISSINIPNSVILLGYMCFSNCQKLKYLEIPDSVTDIRLDAFSMTTATVVCSKDHMIRTCQNADINGLTFIEPIKNVKPSITSCTNTSSGISLKWNKVNDVDGYIIFRNGKELKRVTKLTYTDAAVKNYAGGSGYKYSIQAYRVIAGNEYVSLKSAEKQTYRITAPSIKSWSNLTGGIKLTWNKVDGATGYIVKRTNSKGETVTAGKVTSNYFTDSATKSVLNGSKYKYSVQSYVTVNNVKYKSNLSAAVTVYRLKATTITNWENKAGGIKLTWNKVTGATGYIVKRTNSKGETVTAGKVTTNYFTDTATKSVENGSAYKYTVTAYKTVGSVDKTSPASAAVKAYRLKATSITTWANKTDGIKIVWSKVTGATGYIIKRTNSKGETVTAGTVTTNYFTDTATKNVLNGSAYKYTVQAYKTIGTKKYTAPVSVAKTVYRMKAPASFSLASEGGYVKVTFTQPNGIGYEIYRATSKTGTYQSVKAVLSGTSYTDKTVTKGKTYYYKIKSYKTINGVKIYSDSTVIKAITV